MIKIQDLTKYYGKRLAVDNIDFSVEKGEFVVVRGPSGSGKTTLLLTIGGMLRPTSGNVMIDGDNIYSLSERNRAVFRSQSIGFVFQTNHVYSSLKVRAGSCDTAITVGIKAESMVNNGAAMSDQTSNPYIGLTILAVTLKISGP